MKTSIPILATAVLLLAGAAEAQSQQTYLYDANGRLTATTTARTSGSSQMSFHVLDDADNRTLTGAFPVSRPPASNQLSNPYQLVLTEKLTSANGQYTMTLEASGDLVIRNNSGGLVWNSCTGQGRGATLIVEPSGLLAIYDSGINRIWSAGAALYPGAKLTLENSGVAVLRTVGSSVIWQSTTSCI